jgi:integrase
MAQRGARVQARAGARQVADVPFHALRHTHASLLFAQGVHGKVVQERLGHSSIAITLDRYSHMVPSLDQQAATARGVRTR